eukprot:1101144-Alexandrium_andersonii.AAC.1
MQSPAVPTTAMGTIAMTPAAMMAKPSFLEAFVRGCPWSSSGQRQHARTGTPFSFAPASLAASSVH